MFRILLSGIALLLLFAQTGFADDEAGYGKVVGPFLKSYCSDCHTGDKFAGATGTMTGLV